MKPPLEALKLKTYCEACGDRDKGARHRAHLEPAFNANWEPKTLCRACRIGCAELLEQRNNVAPRPLVIVLEGGLCQDVFRIDSSGAAIDLTHTVLDWDQFEQDPAEDIADRFAGYPTEVKQYIRTKLPEVYEQFQEAIRFRDEDNPEEPRECPKNT